MKAELIKPLTLATLVALGTPALAQDETAAATDAEAAAAADAEAAVEAEAPAEDAAPADTGLDMGTDVAAERQPGQVYVADVHGAWELRCAHNPAGEDPCQMYQLLKDSDDNAVAEINILRLPEGGPAAAGATFIAPLETLLTQQLTLAVDSGSPKRYAFRLCAQLGCMVQMGFTAEEIANMKAGAVATATIVPAIAPDQKVELPISLTGFTAAFDALTVPPAAPAQ